MKKYIVNDKKDPMHGILVEHQSFMHDHTSVKVVKDGRFELVDTDRLDEYDPELAFARRCDCCGSGMNSGLIYGDGGYMCEACADSACFTETLAEAGYKTREESYEMGFHFMTDWKDEDDKDYYMLDGDLVKMR